MFVWEIASGGGINYTNTTQDAFPTSMIAMHHTAGLIMYENSCRSEREPYIRHLSVRDRHGRVEEWVSERDMGGSLSY